MTSLYVCSFSNGAIKVGRAADPMARMAQHADRVSCVGISVVERFVVACAGPAVSCELALIRRCTDSASKRNSREWFDGLVFSDVCQWATEAASLAAPEPEGPLHEDNVLIEQMGGPARLAEILGYSRNGVQRIHNWKKRGIPPAVKLAHPAIFLGRLRQRSALAASAGA
jgi:hypothetical protein